MPNRKRRPPAPTRSNAQSAAARPPSNAVPAVTHSRPTLNNLFSLFRDVLVAAALSARDRAVPPFDGGSHRATAVSSADGDTPWADADSIVIPPTVPIVAVVAVPPDLN